ncbi:MAG: hypothetical protein HYZ58_04185 [Acidobacteria bacterium]|nr:hypothetical protein [Acidobacteriota bacterium]MBI3262334.1 hypothetical protein [Acidobacteriota bacterium]
MNARAALQFVRRHGIVLESARGPAPSFAEAVAGERIRGSWWGHPKSHEIFWLTRAVRDSPDVLVCRVLDGKVTYVHRRLWPALVRLASELGRDRLAAIREIHTASGKHIVKVSKFPAWVPPEVTRAAKGLSAAAARSSLGVDH